MEGVTDKSDRRLLVGILWAMAAIRGYSYYRLRHIEDVFFVAGFLLIGFAAYKDLPLQAFRSGASIKNKLHKLAGYVGLLAVAIGLVVLIAP